MIEQLLLHGATLYPISTTIDDEEYCSNLGIAYYKDQLVVNIRAITYIPGVWSQYSHSSNNYIGFMDNSGDINTTKLPWIDGGGKVWDIYHGREDMRLVIWNNTLYGYATRTDIIDGKGCIEISEFDDDLNIKSSILVDNIIDIEKNWMSIPDQPFTFVWWNNPVTIVKVDPETGHIDRKELDIRFDDVKGSTPLMKYKDKYITLVHHTSERGYEEAFITYSEDFKTANMGPWFKLSRSGIEFITGMITVGDYIYISMSINDIVPFIVKIPVELFDQWYSGTLNYIDRHLQLDDNIIYNYINDQNYKRALELLSMEYDIKYFVIFLWMMISKKHGLFLDYRVLNRYIDMINTIPESPDKYYLLSIVYNILNIPHEEYIYKAKQLGVPSSFFNLFFNEHYIK